MVPNAKWRYVGNVVQEKENLIAKLDQKNVDNPGCLALKALVPVLFCGPVASGDVDAVGVLVHG